jgi:hypothetical protein
VEAAGYIVRCLSTQNVSNKTLYVAQFCLIVLAPVLMAAACYVIFGRIFYNVVPKHERTMKLLWVPPRFLTPIFVVCDIIALFVQLVGAIVVTSVNITDSDAQTKLNRGKNIALVGLGVQIACFGLFSIIAVRFHFTSKRFESDFKARTAGSTTDEKYYFVEDKERRLKTNWPALLLCVNAACILILVRSIYRVCDFALGKTGYTAKNEWCAYVFDALPIFPCVALFTYWHPARYLPYLGFRMPRHARGTASSA